MAGATRGDSHRLQRAITAQIEQARRDRFHALVQHLPQTDTRREAWMACDTLSTQWVTSWPTERREMGPRVFEEVFATYLGRDSPAVRTLAGRQIPCSTTARVCDAAGQQLGLATLPGGSHTSCHDTVAEAIWSTMRQAGLEVDTGADGRGPRQLFHRVIPAAVLAGQAGRKPAIIPDGMTPRLRLGRETQEAAHLMDVKTVHGGGPAYCVLGGDCTGSAEWSGRTPRGPSGRRLCSTCTAHGCTV